MRLRYSVRIDVEIPARDLPQARERALRLLRPSVRDKCRESIAYVGAYRGSFFSLAVREAPPADRIDLKARRRKLRRKPR